MGAVVSVSVVVIISSVIISSSVVSSVSIRAGRGGREGERRAGGGFCTLETRGGIVLMVRRITGEIVRRFLALVRRWFRRGLSSGEQEILDERLRALGYE